MARRNHEQGLPLRGADEANLLTLDVTRLSAEQAATQIAQWLAGLEEPSG